MNEKQIQKYTEYTDLKNLKTAVLVAASTSSKEAAVSGDYLSELERLCETYGIKPLTKIACNIKKIEAAMFLGSGKLEEIKEIVQELKPDLLIFDDELTPHQQRNLEGFFNKPIIDRTELIIEVFAQRAQTREAKLQIELAKVRYQLPRLKRLWTHLSRQSGGGGGAGGGAATKGEGEKQIEIDRRLLKKKVDDLKKELELVRIQRETQRRARMRSGIPTFAIVGYTNAGKSTLLKALTNADVLVEDKLFATLDTTTRKFTLPNKQEILLIDTVGFIRKIPHLLVAAFKSTLEEVVHTDILLHLIDVSHPMAEEQAEETLKVLQELEALERPIITVLNKIDQCENSPLLYKFRIKYPRTVQISASNQIGFEDLIERMMQELSLLRKTVNLRIPQSQYALVSELMREGRVINISYEEDNVDLHIEIPRQLEYKVVPFMMD